MSLRSFFLNTFRQQVDDGERFLLWCKLGTGRVCSDCSFGGNYISTPLQGHYVKVITYKNVRHANISLTGWLILGCFKCFHGSICGRQ